MAGAAEGTWATRKSRQTSNRPLDRRSEVTEDERLDERYALAYRAACSSRYHRRRASFLINLDKVTNLLAIIAGTSVFVSLTQNGPVIFAQVAALLISVLAIGQVVFGFGTIGARHAEWMRAWDKLGNEIRATRNPTDEDLIRWNDTRSEIEGERVFELRALGYDCENQTKSHLGIAEGIVRIGRAQRFFIHFGTFQNEFPEVPQTTTPPARIPGATN